MAVVYLKGHRSAVIVSYTILLLSKTVWNVSHSSVVAMSTTVSRVARNVQDHMSHNPQSTIHNPLHIAACASKISHNSPCQDKMSASACFAIRSTRAISQTSQRRHVVHSRGRCAATVCEGMCPKADSMLGPVSSAPGFVVQVHERDYTSCMYSKNRCVWAPRKCVSCWWRSSKRRSNDGPVAHLTSAQTMSSPILRDPTTVLRAQNLFYRL
jgi:hypothetical protein